MKSAEEEEMEQQVKDNSDWVAEALKANIRDALIAAEQRGRIQGRKRGIKEGRREGLEQAAKVAEETPLPHNEAYAARIRNLKD